MKKGIVVLLVLLGLVGAAWLAWNRNAPSTAGAAAEHTVGAPQQADEAIADATKADAARGKTATHTSPRTAATRPVATRPADPTLAAAPMPAPGAPLSEAFDVLAAKASAG